MTELEQIQQEYFSVLKKNKLEESELDYGIFRKQVPFLDQMASVKNSGLTVFDFNKKEHIYKSYNLHNLFGYDLKKIDDLGTDYYNSRIHPEDIVGLMRNGLALIKFYFQLPISKRKDYKLQNEYRILNAQDEYIRIIEQHQVLELDKYGNLWLALSVMDVSPNQDAMQSMQSQMLNCKTGEAKPIEINSNNVENTTLSRREKEILNFVKDGLLSKEISNNLSISVHTVNTHRQNILKKLGANNSIEAIEYASKLRLA